MPNITKPKLSKEVLKHLVLNYQKKDIIEQLPIIGIKISRPTLNNWCKHYKIKDTKSQYHKKSVFELKVYLNKFTK